MSSREEDENAIAAIDSKRGIAVNEQLLPNATTVRGTLGAACWQILMLVDIGFR